MDIQPLRMILEKIKQEQEIELLSVGVSARYHTNTTHGDNRTFETGEGVYTECQVAFARLQDIDSDIRKLNSVISTISKLSAKYLD